MPSTYMFSTPSATRCSDIASCTQPKSGIFQYRTALGKPQFQLDIMNQRVNHLLMNLLGPV